MLGEENTSGIETKKVLKMYHERDIYFSHRMCAKLEIAPEEKIAISISKNNPAGVPKMTLMKMTAIIGMGIVQKTQGAVILRARKHDGYIFTLPRPLYIDFKLERGDSIAVFFQSNDQEIKQIVIFKNNDILNMKDEIINSCLNAPL